MEVSLKSEQKVRRRCTKHFFYPVLKYMMCPPSFYSVMTFNKWHLSYEQHCVGTGLLNLGHHMQEHVYDSFGCKLKLENSWTIMKTFTSERHLPLEQVEWDVHGHAGVRCHGHRLSVSGHVTVDAWHLKNRNIKRTETRRSSWCERTDIIYYIIIWCERVEDLLLNSCSILPLRKPILAASPCTSSTLRGSAIRMSCMMPLASAWALKDMYSTCSFTSNCYKGGKTKSSSFSFAWIDRALCKIQKIKNILPWICLPSPASSAHLGSYGRLFLVHNTRAWWPKKGRISCRSSIVLFFKSTCETHHVLLIAGPFLEDLQRLASVQHTRSGEHHLEGQRMVVAHCSFTFTLWGGGDIK